MSNQSIISIKSSRAYEALGAIDEFIRERPGFKGQNYSSKASYQSDLRAAKGFKEKAESEWTKLTALVATDQKAKAAVCKAMSERLASNQDFRLYRDSEDGKLKAAHHTFSYSPVEKHKRAMEFLQDVRASAEKSLGVQQGKTRPKVDLNAQWNRHPPSPAPVARSRGMER